MRKVVRLRIDFDIAGKNGEPGERNEKDKDYLEDSQYVLNPQSPFEGGAMDDKHESNACHANCALIPLVDLTPCCT
jgi:hypothetical protein